MVAVGGSVIVAAKATPMAGSSESLYNQGVAAVQEMSREVSQAITISEASAAKLAFTVPDRTGDGVAESITYTLTNDNRVTRNVNSAGEVEIAARVKGLNFGYVTGLRTQTTTSAAVEGAEQVLFSGTDTTGAEIAFDSNSVAIQSIRPILPPEATSWRITKALMLLKSDGLATGSVRLNVYRTDSTNTPVGSSLAMAAQSELLIGSSYNWRTFSFGSMTLAPTDGAAIVATHGSVTITPSGGSVLINTGGSGSGGRGIHLSNVVADRGKSLSISLNGTSWTDYVDNSLALEVYGRITSTSTSTTTIQTIDAVDIQLLVAGSKSIRTIAVVGPRPPYSTSPPPPPPNLIEDIIGGVGGIIGGLLGGGLISP